MTLTQKHKKNLKWYVKDALTSSNPEKRNAAHRLLWLGRCL